MPVSQPPCKAVFIVREKVYCINPVRMGERRERRYVSAIRGPGGM
jgi:hypothetical protein